MVISIDRLHGYQLMSLYKLYIDLFLVFLRSRCSNDAVPSLYPESAMDGAVASEFDDVSSLETGSSKTRYRQPLRLHNGSNNKKTMFESRIDSRKLENCPNIPSEAFNQYHHPLKPIYPNRRGM